MTMTDAHRRRILARRLYNLGDQAFANFVEHWLYNYGEYLIPNIAQYRAEFAVAFEVEDFDGCSEEELAEERAKHDALVDAAYPEFLLDWDNEIEAHRWNAQADNDHRHAIRYGY